MPNERPTVWNSRSTEGEGIPFGTTEKKKLVVRYRLIRRSQREMYGLSAKDEKVR
jgi:hypothetical protein